MRRILSHFAFCSLAAAIVFSAATARAESISFADGYEGSVNAAADEALTSESAVEASTLVSDKSLDAEFTFTSPSSASEVASSQSVNLTPVGIMVATSATATVPEPATLVLLGLGFLGVLVARRRSR